MEIAFARIGMKFHSVTPMPYIVSDYDKIITEMVRSSILVGNQCFVHDESSIILKCIVDLGHTLCFVCT